MSVWVGFACGLFVGTVIGVIMMGVLIDGKDRERTAVERGRGRLSIVAEAPGREGWSLRSPIFGSQAHRIRCPCGNSAMIQERS